MLPGGFGTFDELFEALCLVQTRKVTSFPVVLLGEAYWGGLADWPRSTVLAEGKIKEADLALFRVTDDLFEAVRLVHQAESEYSRRREEEAARVAAADRPVADASGRSTAGSTGERPAPCSSSGRIDPGHVELAAAVGTELARRGHTLVSGGGSASCMGAVARAARTGGARTVGVVPRALVDLEAADHDADELVVTDDMRSRKAGMDERDDAFLTLPGGLGTLEELLEIWVSRTLAMHGKPVVVLDPGGVFDPLRAQVDLLVQQGCTSAGPRGRHLGARRPGCVRRLEAGPQTSPSRPRRTSSSRPSRGPTRLSPVGDRRAGAADQRQDLGAREADRPAPAVEVGAGVVEGACRTR